MLLVAGVAFLALPAAVPAPMARWKDSSEGIHAFLTFDSEASVAAIKEFGSRIDYIWGHGANTATWRAANPDIVLSHYIPYTRDPGCPQMSGKDGPHCHNKTSPFVPGCPTCLPWWKQNHPDLVLYQCDKKVRPYYCFATPQCSTSSAATTPVALRRRLLGNASPERAVGTRAYLSI